MSKTENKSLLLHFRDRLSPSGITRQELKEMAEMLGETSETKVAHLALARLYYFLKQPEKEMTREEFVAASVPEIPESEVKSRTSLLDVLRENLAKDGARKGPHADLSLSALSALKDEYMATLNDSFEDEKYTTERGFAAPPLEEFLEWLHERLGEGAPDHG